MLDSLIHMAVSLDCSGDTSLNPCSGPASDMLFGNSVDQIRY